VRTTARSLPVLLLAMLAALPAAAFRVHGLKWSATYAAAYSPVFGPQGIPFSGTMKLTVDRGIITGTYTGESVRPDPFYRRVVPITGGVEHGHIMLNFGAYGGFTVRGTLAEDGEISGSATIRGRLYRFLARVKSSP
jgi:hypothetical protein